jgi:hypothetical protein
MRLLARSIVLAIVLSLAVHLNATAQVRNVIVLANATGGRVMADVYHGNHMTTRFIEVGQSLDLSPETDRVTLKRASASATAPFFICAARNLQRGNYKIKRHGGSSCTVDKS